jgi:hypothetical protein
MRKGPYNWSGQKRKEKKNPTNGELNWKKKQTKKIWKNIEKGK